MSLIHEALKTVDTGGAAAGSPPRVAATAPVAVNSFKGWLGGVTAFALVVLAGGGAYWLWQSALPAPKSAVSGTQVPHQTVVQAPDPRPDVAAARPTAAVSVAVLASNSDEKLPAALDDIVISAIKIEKSGGAVLPVVVQPAASRPAVPKEGARADRKAPAKAVATPSETVDDTPVELRFARFVTAMRQGNASAAEAELALLRKRLPDGALGLVRAQAWFDLKNGHEDAAVVGYQSILDRLPGDEEAAINVASVHSLRQQGEMARAVLAAAVRVNPDSVALRTALAQFVSTSRP